RFRTFTLEATKVSSTFSPLSEGGIRLSSLGGRRGRRTQGAKNIRKSSPPPRLGQAHGAVKAVAETGRVHIDEVERAAAECVCADARLAERRQVGGSFGDVGLSGLAADEQVV